MTLSSLHAYLSRADCRLYLISKTLIRPYLWAPRYRDYLIQNPIILSDHFNLASLTKVETSLTYVKFLDGGPLSNNLTLSIILGYTAVAVRRFKRVHFNNFSRISATPHLHNYN